MTDTATGTAPPGELSPGGLRRVLIVLCVTEFTSWGVLFYAFPVLAPGISAATGWSATWVTAAFSAGQLSSALAGVPVGRALDRFGPRLVMTTGSVLTVPAMLLIAGAPSPGWFVAAWALAGVAMSAVLYGPAFAALTRWWGPRRVTALTAVTLVGGLAGTAFAPLTALIAHFLDWRGTYVVLTVVLAVTIPLHVIGLRGPWPRAVTPHADRPNVARQVARSRPFALLTIAMAVAAFAVYGAVIIQVPLLIERGMSTGTAAVAFGLGGLGQLCGRIGYRRLDAATTVRARTAILLGAGAVTTVLLGVVPGPAGLLICAVILAGVARGAYTLLQATVVSDRWGAENYGRLYGLLSAPLLVSAALSPWACGRSPADGGLSGGVRAAGRPDGGRHRAGPVQRPS